MNYHITMHQLELFEYLEEKINAKLQQKKKPLLIAINGIEGSGKTTFAKQLVAFLNAEHYQTIHVSIDGYHNTKTIRYQQGSNSAKGYYEDSYNEQAFVDNVLKSSQEAQPKYTKAIHDIEMEQEVFFEPENLHNNTILITDGAYVFKKIYEQYWDLKIYLKTDFETARIRGAKRDAVRLGSFENAVEKFKKRYHAASKMYIQENNPEVLADICIDITDFKSLRLLKK